MTKEPDLSVNIGGIDLKNPVMTASGTFGYGEEFADFFDLNHLGGVIVKGLSLLPSKGNKPPRIVETPCGMLNAIGLENVGIDVFITEKLPYLKTISVPLIVNIYGQTMAEYGELAAHIDKVPDIDGIEINISCPNVTAGGVAFGTDPAAVFRVVSTVRKTTSKPMMVKLSPNVTDIVEIAKQAEDAGADALSLINTITGMAIDIETRQPRLANITGGLSGPAIKPVALRMVWQVAGAVGIPVVGIGGIMDAADAIEFIIAGASAVQVGTANFVNPMACMEILEGMRHFLTQRGIARLSDMIGTVEI